MNVQELADTLKDINEGTIPASKAKEILAGVNPLNISLWLNALNNSNGKKDLH